ncbi:hypothetical protein [Serratia sp. M24T3]|uniref:hypothetical protein n=1 Tax=Serratia sp. M24T3 TaxID=932213 RepID=UPI00025B95D4|nr:hypothetical protein [Serratia sp. M24T3]EIC84586.1 hypothetical protein SPM24T3_10501 [Serratia sp. M24T3]
MAHLDPKRAFRFPQAQGRAFDKLTLTQKGVWSLHAFNSAAELHPNGKVPASLLPVAKGGGIGANLNNKDKETPNNVESVAVVGGSWNSASSSFLTGVAMAALAGPVTGIATGLLSFLAKDANSYPLHALLEIQKYDSLIDYYDELDNSTLIDPNAALSKLILDVMVFGCKQRGMTGNVRAKLKNTTFRVTIFDRVDSGYSILNDKKKAYLTTTPYKILTGQFMRETIPYLGYGRATAYASQKIHWSGDFKNDDIQQFLKDNSVTTYVDKRLETYFKNSSNRSTLKSDVRNTAELVILWANRFGIMKKQNKRVLTSEDLDNVQQVKFNGDIIPNLFAIEGIVYSLNFGFTPVNFSDVQYNYANNQELLDEIKKGLTESEKHARSDALKFTGDLTLLQRYLRDKSRSIYRLGIIGLQLGSRGKVQDLAIDRMIEVYTENFDTQTFSVYEQSWVSGAAIMEIPFKLLPFWAPFAGLSLGVNIGLGLLSSTPDFIRAFAEDDPKKASSFIKQALITLAINALGGALSNVKTFPINKVKLDKVYGLIRRSISKILKNPEKKTKEIVKFLLAANRIISGPSHAQGTVASLLKLPPGQLNLLIRVLGAEARSIIKGIEKYFAKKQRKPAGVSTEKSTTEKEELISLDELTDRLMSNESISLGSLPSNINMLRSPLSRLYKTEEGESIRNITIKSYGPNQEHLYYQLTDLNKNISKDPDDIIPTGTELTLPFKLIEREIKIPNIFDTVRQ